MLGHEPEVARLLHHEHTERLTRAARRPGQPRPAVAERERAPRRKLAFLARLHLRVRA